MSLEIISVVVFVVSPSGITKYILVMIVYSQIYIIMGFEIVLILTVVEEEQF